MNATPKKKTAMTVSIRRYVLTGFLVVLLLGGGLGGWAALAHISSAVVAGGLVVVESNVKRVQHREGGIVGEILVANGDRVKAGDLLVRLDDTLVKANLGVVMKDLSERKARRARLEAERDGAESITFPDDLLAEMKDDAEIRRAVEGQKTLFQARRTTLKGQDDQLRERIVQLKEQIEGLEAQKVAKADESKLIEEELAGLDELYKKGHVPVTRIIALRRDAARLKGEAGALVSQIAVNKGKIAETELQILQTRRDFQENLLRELQEVQPEIASLEEKRIAAEDQLRRIDIRAPISGLVHELAIHTVGGVIQGGETLLSIVPQSDALVIEAKLSPNDIDQVAAGQSAVVTFSAFNRRTTPQLNAEVLTVSPDLSRDEKSGVAYFTARLKLKDGETARLGDKQLLPGMPAEVFIATGDRTVISYLIKPLADQVRRTFREQ